MQVNRGVTGRLQRHRWARASSKPNQEVRDDAFSIAAGTPNNLLDVLANDTILPGAPATLTVREIVIPPAHGTAVIDATKTALFYSPNNGFLGEDVLVYRATDGLGGTATGTGRVDCASDGA